MNTQKPDNTDEDEDNDGVNWKWWHFALAGVLIAAWSIWRWWETGFIKHLGGLVLAVLCLLVGFGMSGKKKAP